MNIFGTMIYFLWDIVPEVMRLAQQAQTFVRILVRSAKL